MKPNQRNIVSFYELEEKWQKEALSNLDKYAHETMYIEPEDDEEPEKHILWDLSECMVADGEHEGFKYNASIGISNNSAMLLNLSDCGEEAEFIFV